MTQEEVLLNKVCSKVTELLKSYSNEQIVFNENDKCSASNFVISIDKDLIVHFETTNIPIKYCSFDTLNYIYNTIIDGGYKIYFNNIVKIQQVRLSIGFHNIASLSTIKKAKEVQLFDFTPIVDAICSATALKEVLLPYGWIENTDIGYITHSPIEIFDGCCQVYVKYNNLDGIGEVLASLYPSIFSGKTIYVGGNDDKPNMFALGYTDEFLNKLAELKNSCKVLFPVKIDPFKN